MEFNEKENAKIQKIQVVTKQQTGNGISQN
jgi:hypothetical protein